MPVKPPQSASGMLRGLLPENLGRKVVPVVTAGWALAKRKNFHPILRHGCKGQSLPASACTYVCHALAGFHTREQCCNL